VDAQRWQSQKYSGVETLHDLRVGSFSRRKSLPSLRERNEAEHEGLLHLATHNGTPLVLCASKRLGYDCFAYRNVARFLVGYADRQRLGSPVPTLVLFHCSLYLVTHRVNARN